MVLASLLGQVMGHKLYEDLQVKGGGGRGDKCALLAHLPVRDGAEPFGATTADRSLDGEPATAGAPPAAGCR